MCFMIGPLIGARKMIEGKAETMNRCEICGEPMEEGVPFRFHGYDGNDCPRPPLAKTLVAVETGIRERRDGSIWMYVGAEEIECSSKQEAEAMLSDLGSMLRQLGGTTHPPHKQ